MVDRGWLYILYLAGFLFLTYSFFSDIIAQVAHIYIWAYLWWSAFAIGTGVCLGIYRLHNYIVSNCY